MHQRMRISGKFTLNVLISLSIVILFVGIHFSIQQRVVYNTAFKHLFSNYIDGAYKADTPYVEVYNYRLKHWDCRAYAIMKDNLYDVSKSGGDYIFAWFPLFPLLWKYSHLTSIGISMLNVILYIISAVMLSSLFSKHDTTRWKKLVLFALLFSFPGFAVFFIPYTEALFMILLTVAFWGLFKNKYWVYSIGVFLAAMTRSVAVILIVTFLAAEFIVFLKEKDLLARIKNVFLKILPLLAGTMTVALIQLYNGSGSLFKFIEVQKYWGAEFQIPMNFKDYSEESFAGNVGTIFFFVFPCLAYFFYLFLSIIKKKKSIVAEDNSEKIQEYLFNVSVIYTLVMFFFILFFKGGVLTGITRYIISTPFFFIIVCVGLTKVEKVRALTKYLFFFVLMFLGLMFLITLCMTNYWGNKFAWNFSETGFLLVAANIGFFLFNKNNIWFRFIFYSILFFNVLWATYLFNMMISNCRWICF
jgi:hypothetical protein